MKEYFLKKCKKFCMFPFVGYRDLHGYFSPCPIYWRDNTFNSDNKINDNVLNNLNSEEMKQLRKEMITNAEKTPIFDKGCKICKEHNDSGLLGLRNAGNVFLEKYFYEAMNNLNEDFTCKTPLLKFISITHNIVCNFKCKMCYPERSSKILEEYNKNLIDDEKIDISFYNLTEEQKEKNLNLIFDEIRKCEYLYFGYSGEPFITYDHLKVLNNLIQEKNTDKTIIYHSNCSVLQYKQFDILERLSHFKKVIILGSIDAVNDHFKVIRPSPYNWDTVESNILKIINSKNIVFNVYASVGILNIHHILDLHKYFIEKIGLDKNMILLNPIYNVLTAKTLPDIEKQLVIKKYKEHIEYLSGLVSCGLNFHYNTAEKEFTNFSNFLLKESHYKLQDSIDEIKRLDKLRNTDTFKVVNYLNRFA